MRVLSILSLLAAALPFCTALHAGETTIDAAKAAQLRRLEPLNADKIDVFVEAGQLTRQQADWVRQHVNSQGQLNLPASSIIAHSPRPAPRHSDQEAVPGARQQPYAGFKYDMSASDRERLTRAIQDYRRGPRSEIGQQLRQARPAVNELIATAYPDVYDLPVKIRLWEEVAGPGNPEAAIGLFETHRQAYELARPILIPYAKDVGGLLVRRRDANGPPAERFFTSREMRDMILEIEELVSRCSGVLAASFLMDVYAGRYDEGDAPMRDSSRDRDRLIRACGGDPREFDQDEPHTWSSKLDPRERMQIAERLVPWLHRSNNDRRKIARNALMICAPRNHPHWEAGQGEWERWLQSNREVGDTQ